MSNILKPFTYSLWSFLSQWSWVSLSISLLSMGKSITQQYHSYFIWNMLFSFSYISSLTVPHALGSLSWSVFFFFFPFTKRLYNPFCFSLNSWCTFQKAPALLLKDLRHFSEVHSHIIHFLTMWVKWNVPLEAWARSFLRHAQKHVFLIILVHTILLHILQFNSVPSVLQFTIVTLC